MSTYRASLALLSRIAGQTDFLMEHHTRILSKLVTGCTEELSVTPLFLKLLVRHSWSVECHPIMDMNFWGPGYPIFSWWATGHTWKSFREGTFES